MNPNLKGTHNYICECDCLPNHQWHRFSPPGNDSVLVCFFFLPLSKLQKAVKQTFSACGGQITFSACCIRLLNSMTACEKHCLGLIFMFLFLYQSSCKFRTNRSTQWSTACSLATYFSLCSELLRFWMMSVWSPEGCCCHQIVRLIRHMLWWGMLLGLTIVSCMK